MTRLHSLLAAGVACLATSLVAAPAMAQDKTLTISWWGFNGDKLDEFIIKPFKEKCGCEIVFETGNNADRLNKIKIRNGEGVDVAYFTDAYSQIGIKEGLFQTIDTVQGAEPEGLYDLAKAPQGEFGPAYTIGRVGVIYDTAKVKAPITSWNDLWKEDFKSALSLPGITTTAGPMAVMIAGDHAGVDRLCRCRRCLQGDRSAEAERRQELQHRLGAGEPVLDGRDQRVDRPGLHAGPDPGCRADRCLGRPVGRRDRHAQHGQHPQGRCECRSGA